MSATKPYRKKGAAYACRECNIELAFFVTGQRGSLPEYGVKHVTELTDDERSLVAETRNIPAATLRRLRGRVEDAHTSTVVTDSADATDGEVPHRQLDRAIVVGRAVGQS